MTTSKLPRSDDGTLSAYAWPGGYQIVYFTADGGCLCPDCANGRNGSEATEARDADAGWRLAWCNVLYEGRINCDHCGVEIVGSYED